MSVVDPLRFFIALIVICGLLQVFGVMEGPCNLPPDTFNSDVSYEEWKISSEEWRNNR